MCCSALSTHCNTIQHSAIQPQYNTLQYNTIHTASSELYYVARCCRVLQKDIEYGRAGVGAKRALDMAFDMGGIWDCWCVAVRCSVLQCIIERHEGHMDGLGLEANTPCNTRLHTSTYCNTLQLTSTHSYIPICPPTIYGQSVV